LKVCEGLRGSAKVSRSSLWGERGAALSGPRFSSRDEARDSGRILALQIKGKFEIPTTCSKRRVRRCLFSSPLSPSFVPNRVSRPPSAIDSSRHLSLCEFLLSLSLSLSLFHFLERGLFCLLPRVFKLFKLRLFSMYR
jgi:hypothetical protein